MPKERLSLDALLESQGAIRGSVESVPGSSDQVRVTPVQSGNGCACDRSIVIAKNEIEAVTVTDEVRDCCGKRLPVVEISFANETVASVFQQVHASAVHRRTPPPSPPPGHFAAHPAVARRPYFGPTRPPTYGRNPWPAPGFGSQFMDVSPSGLMWEDDPYGTSRCNAAWLNCKAACAENSRENPNYDWSGCSWECDRIFAGCNAEAIDKWPGW
jgi:hypothetical protein